jgi:uncharacterized protein
MAHGSAAFRTVEILMQRSSSQLLPDGKRLHLHHGPIDLIIEANGSATSVRQAYECAKIRFDTVLDELVSELPQLRCEVSSDGPQLRGRIASGMLQAVLPYRAYRITPMAAVAGAVADDVLRTMVEAAELSRAYVNNGGDIAFHLSEGETFRIASPSGMIAIAASHAARGAATSGWRGRSFSFGIADTVTVLANTAAEADAAATMIANHVDLPGSVKVKRQAACELWPDSDLRDRLVTVGVEKLDDNEIEKALDRGLSFARSCLSSGRLLAASLMLENRIVRCSFDGMVIEHDQAA